MFAGLLNVQRSSTTHNSGRATSQDGNCTCRVGKVQRIFISGQVYYSAIRLSRISRFTNFLRHSGEKLALELSATEATIYTFSQYVTVYSLWLPYIAVILTKDG